MRNVCSLLKSVGCVTPRYTQKSQLQYQRRWLGQAPTGRQLNNVDGSWEEAKKLFYKPALTYGEFAKRVEAFRMFAFWGLVGGVTVDLIMDPPKSQYWSKWNALKMPSRLMDKFGSKPKGDPLPSHPELGNDYMTDAAREYHKVCNL